MKTTLLPYFFNKVITRLEMYSINNVKIHWGGGVAYRQACWFTSAVSTLSNISYCLDK